MENNDCGRVDFGVGEVDERDVVDNRDAGETVLLEGGVFNAI